METDDMIGKIIDNYRIEEKLGAGGTGVVYRARHVNLNRDAALKMLHPHVADDRTFLAWFQREATILASLEHENIVRIFDFRKTEIGWVIAMEYVEGVSLARKLEDAGALHYLKVLPVARQLLSCLSYAHARGVIHRDIKPGNLMLTAGGRVKLTDFGLAKEHVAGAHAATTGVIAGTPKYMSPEQMSAPDQVDARSDIYAVGMTLYEMLAGRTPFEDTESHLTIPVRVFENAKYPPPSRYNPDIPPALCGIVMQALEKSPEHRFPNAEAMLAGLRQFEAETHTREAMKQGRQAITIPVRPAKRQRRLFRAAAAGLGLGAALFVMLRGEAVENRLSEWRHRFAPPAARLTLDSVPGRARISLNDSLLGYTPVSDIAVKPGRAVLSLRKPGFAPADTLLSLKSGAVYNLVMLLKEPRAAAKFSLTTDPAGASLTIDGVAYGHTPAEIDNMKPGPHTVLVAKPGYAAAELAITLAEGSNQPQHLHLEKLEAPRPAPVRSATLHLQAIGNGLMVVDGRKYATGAAAPLRVPLLPGTHTVGLEHPEVLGARLELTLRENESRRLACYFDAYINVLTLDGDSDKETWATLVVDGKRTQVTGSVWEYPLPPGKHAIAVTREGYTMLGAPRRVTVVPGFKKTVVPLVFHIRKNFVAN